ncbi:hypothetical protein [Azospirillum halopraeferens]|uniref:hypothetical protein n=1 Tax=Azospirillum halopraeferens TaxID=34010 RepID=UPI0012EBAEAC|nr:hypothetical protein [Azospirillum halopraeferens]
MPDTNSKALLLAQCARVGLDLTVERGGFGFPKVSFCFLRKMQESYFGLREAGKCVASPRTHPNDPVRVAEEQQDFELDAAASLAPIIDAVEACGVTLHVRVATNRSTGANVARVTIAGPHQRIV